MQGCEQRCLPHDTDGESRAPVPDDPRNRIEKKTSKQEFLHERADAPRENNPAGKGEEVTGNIRNN